MRYFNPAEDRWVEMPDPVPRSTRGAVVSDDSRLHVGIKKPELPAGREEYHLSPNEMRAAIRLAGHRDSNLVRQCMYRAEREGFNGEDTMTLIAYYALRMYDDSFCREVERLELSNHPLMMVVPK